MERVFKAKLSKWQFGGKGNTRVSHCHFFQESILLSQLTSLSTMVDMKGVVSPDDDLTEEATWCLATCDGLQDKKFNKKRENERTCCCMAMRFDHPTLHPFNFK